MCAMIGCRNWHHGVRMKQLNVILIYLTCLFGGFELRAQDRWDTVYEPQVFEGLPCRVMKPLGFDAKKNVPGYSFASWSGRQRNQ